MSVRPKPDGCGRNEKIGNRVGYNFEKPFNKRALTFLRVMGKEDLGGSCRSWMLFLTLSIVRQ
jgi:hypothetical protein